MSVRNIGYNQMLIETYRRKIFGEFHIIIMNDDKTTYHKANMDEIENLIFNCYGSLGESDSWIRFYNDYKTNNDRY